MFTNILKSMLGKALLATTVMGGALFFAGAPNAQAADRYREDRRAVRYDNHRLREVEVRPGFYNSRPDYRLERREVVRGYYDRFGCWHRY